MLSEGLELVFWDDQWNASASKKNVVPEWEFLVAKCLFWALVYSVVLLRFDWIAPTNIIYPVVSDNKNVWFHVCRFEED